MCCRLYFKVGKLAALSAKGQACDGFPSTQLANEPDNIVNCSNVALSLNIVCTNDITNFLVVNPTQAYHVVSTVSEVNVNFMLDTGASLSLLSNETWEKVSTNKGMEETMLQP